MPKAEGLVLKVAVKSCPARERVVSAKLRRRVSIRGHNVLEHACDRRMIEKSCAVDLSGGINAAPMWMRQYQDSAEMKLPTAQPFDEEHGTGKQGSSRAFALRPSSVGDAFEVKKEPSIYTGPPGVVQTSEAFHEPA
jgi:hypothetical protein